MENPVNTLVLSGRYTTDSIALWKRAIAEGWNVERLHSPVDAPRSTVNLAVYGEQYFANAVAHAADVALLEAPFDWLTRLPYNLVHRHIEYGTLAGARSMPSRMFFKPADDKCFEAGVYNSGAELPPPDELHDDIPVLMSTPVVWQSECRCFVNRGSVAAVSIYMRNGDIAQVDDGSWPATDEEIDAARRFAEVVLNTPGAQLPPGAVVDVGVIEDRGWAVVEANPAWGSGIYGCDPSGVLAAIRSACVDEDKLTDCDSRWLPYRDLATYR